MISEYYEELQSVWHFNCSVYVEIEHRGGFTLRVRQRWDGFAMSLSTSLSHRSDNARYRRPSLVKMFVATIIASCRSKVEIIISF